MTLSDLYSQFWAELRRYAVSLTHDSNSADDLVQDAFMRAIPYMGLLAGMKPYQQRAWLRRTLKNLFLDEWRARQRREAFLEAAGQQADMFTLWQPILSGNMLDQVPERYRGLLERHYMLGMTGEEIGQELGISAGAVRARLHQALKWLRANKTKFS